MDKISIITTFYNAENFIARSVQSILLQKTDGFKIEYILVNDHTPDHSLDMVKRLCDHNGNTNIEVKIIEPLENLGCGGARKFGIEHATGDYFMFLDADDYYINNDFVSRAYKCITSYNADIVEYGIIYNDNLGHSTKMCVDKQIIFEDPDTAVYYIFKDNTIKFNVWSKIYTKEIVNSYPYSDTRTYEDIRTIPIWVHNAKRIVVMPTVEVNYRAASNSIIRENGLQTRLGTITAMTEICEHFKYSKKIVKALYGRAMIDLSCVLENKTSNNEGFNEMSKLNTKLLSYIFPDKYKEITFNIEDETETIE